MSTDLATSNNEFWNRQLDKLKELRKCNDSGLAKILGVSRQYISKWRSGQQIPAKSKFRILDLLGYNIVFDAVLGLLDDEIADKLRNTDIDRIHALFNLSKDDQKDA
jgi:transcriptional regulator with XRE-family HTH domain